MRTRMVALALLFCMAGAGLLAPPRAYALSGTARSMIVGGEYGLLGGTILGLVSLPLTRSSRAIFIGSSVGLYLGIAIGLYAAWNPNDPENPLAAQAGDPVLYKQEEERRQLLSPPAIWRAEFVVTRF